MKTEGNGRVPVRRDGNGRLGREDSGTRPGETRHALLNRGKRAAYFELPGRLLGRQSSAQGEPSASTTGGRARESLKPKATTD